MSVEVVNIDLLPALKSREASYIVRQIMQVIAPAVEIIDKHGEKYKHEFPWERKYLQDAKFFLYRVKIGTVGRINTCLDAVELGAFTTCAARCNHFTSMALFYMFKMARTRRREYSQLKWIDRWIKTLLNNRHNNLRYLDHVTLED